MAIPLNNTTTNILLLSALLLTITNVIQLCIMCNINAQILHSIKCQLHEGKEK